MRYQITHRTKYTYESPVTVCHYVARLEPKKIPGQACPWHELHIQPEPVDSASRADSFGNHTTYFEIEGSHHELVVTARSFVEVKPSRSVQPDSTPAWETIRNACAASGYTAATVAAEFCFASPLITPGQLFADYARPSFPSGKPILAGLMDLNRRIFTDFKFDPTATDVATPLADVMKNRRGVCQDFAQVMIACLRSMGLPARYVSGYLETLPPPGKARLVGADASHAWAALFCGDALGWMDVDPTNNLLPSERHITVAWGRDFSDVSPLRGVTLGAGEQRLQVAVDVMPVDDE
ncbi:MAG: transglutaminase family protein [Verrucomicrobiaceae bacterium]|nr:transglutaminase family protein [Verrucomicrobiaceae bacterium]